MTEVFGNARSAITATAFGGTSQVLGLTWFGLAVTESNCHQTAHLLDESCWVITSAVDIIARQWSSFQPQYLSLGFMTGLPRPLRTSVHML